jgi:hypothetical protein
MASGSTVRLAKIDATVNDKWAENYGVEGYPTLIYFWAEGEQRVGYKGERSKASIVRWLNKKTRGPLIEISEGQY